MVDGGVAGLCGKVGGGATVGSGTEAALHAAVQSARINADMHFGPDTWRMRRATITSVSNDQQTARQSLSYTFGVPPSPYG